MTTTTGERIPAPSPSALLDVTHQVAFQPARGEGPYLFSASGERYLDFYGGHAVALLGYGHPRLLAALQEQSRTLFFQSGLFPLAVRERAAARLAAFAPEGLNKVFFVNSGAEANENALRIAFLATRRRRVVAVEGAFHGRTAAAAALTWGHEKWYGFPRTPFDVIFVPPDDARALADAVTQDAAAVIVEPVQGVAGARPMSPSFLAAAREVSSLKGALLIFDEVQCGMGRSGWPFVARAVGVTPDILTTAKGLGGGFPVGAVMVGEALGRKVGKGDLGTTFGGGPLAAALVEATLRTSRKRTSCRASGGCPPGSSASAGSGPSRTCRAWGSCSGSARRLPRAKSSPPCAVGASLRAEARTRMWFASCPRSFSRTTTWMNS